MLDFFCLLNIKLSGWNKSVRISTSLTSHNNWVTWIKGPFTNKIRLGLIKTNIKLYIYVCVCIYIIYTHKIVLSTYNFGLQSKSKSNIKKAHCNPLFLFRYFTWIVSLTRLPKSFCWKKINVALYHFLKWL